MTAITVTVTPKFVTPLDLRDIDGNTFELLAPLVYDDATGQRWTVPANTRTDFASIPRVLWWRYPKSGKWNRAAVLHDFLYVNNGVTRERADALFKEAMEVCGVHWWTRNVFHKAVRLGGWKPWGEYRQREQDTV